MAHLDIAALDEVLDDLVQQWIWTYNGIENRENRGWSEYDLIGLKTQLYRLDLEIKEAKRRLAEAKARFYSHHGEYPSDPIVISDNEEEA